MSLPARRYACRRHTLAQYSRASSGSSETSSREWGWPDAAPAEAAFAGRDVAAEVAVDVSDADGAGTATDVLVPTTAVTGTAVATAVTADAAPLTLPPAAPAAPAVLPEAAEAGRCCCCGCKCCCCECCCCNCCCSCCCCDWCCCCCCCNCCCC